MAVDSPGVSPDAGGITGDSPGVSPDAGGTTGDSPDVSPDSGEMAVDSPGVSPDAGGLCGGAWGSRLSGMYLFSAFCAPVSRETVVSVGTPAPRETVVPIGALVWGRIVMSDGLPASGDVVLSHNRAVSVVSVSSGSVPDPGTASVCCRTGSPFRPDGTEGVADRAGEDAGFPVVSSCSQG